LPEDPLAWLGLADACRLAGRTKEAEDAYRAAVEINPHSELAEKARAGSNLLAQSGFERTRQPVPRQDAVNYCLHAMKRFAPMSPRELQNLALELALAGREGFAVHDPSSRYHVKGLEGEFSGLAMVCFLYVAMQRTAPGANVSMDLAAEYEQAKRSRSYLRPAISKNQSSGLGFAFACRLSISGPAAPARPAGGKKARYLV